MFTGLVETTGQITSIEKQAPYRLVVKAPLLADVKLGDSVAVNGCCLTVATTPGADHNLVFELSRETLQRTNLGALRGGDFANLELAMRLGDRLGGHLVSGHVDGVAEVLAIDKQASGWHVRIKLGAELARYVIAKGSICLDGVSLTVNELRDLGEIEAGAEVGLMLIPTTLAKTTWQHLQPGWLLNVEVDMLAKFVERLVNPFLKAPSR